MDDAMPNGFSCTWGGASARIQIPPMAETEEHRYEPVLSRGDAERIADTLRIHAVSEDTPPVSRALSHVVIAHVPGYRPETIAAFRAKLAAALAARGFSPTVETSQMPAPRAPPAAAAPPVLEPVAVPTPAPLAPVGIPPGAPPGFDPAAETDHGFGSLPEATAPEVPPREERRRPEDVRGRGGRVSFWRRRSQEPESK